MAIIADKHYNLVDYAKWTSTSRTLKTTILSATRW